MNHHLDILKKSIELKLTQLKAQLVAGLLCIFVFVTGCCKIVVGFHVVRL